jgi:hypothetical protein
MKSSDRFLSHAGCLFVVGSSTINTLRGNIASSAKCDLLKSQPLMKFHLSLLIGTVLFASGFFHLMLLWSSGADWSGPVSLRKPGLFGVSAGVTVWSIAWVLTQLEPRRNDQRLASFMSGGLLVEVGLITLQYWRGVPSHFNRATALDATIESIMLGVILLVTAGIGWLCCRSRQLQPMIESRAIAIRAGLWLLLVSCGLGLLATIAGEVNLATGRPPEVWGRAGILKYPHGAALHAIQVLPLLSLVLRKLRVPLDAWLLRAAVTSQVLFLALALSQTLCGRGRTEVDLTSIYVLATLGSVFLLKPVRSRASPWRHLPKRTSHQPGVR